MKRQLSAAVFVSAAMIAWRPSMTFAQSTLATAPAATVNEVADQPISAFRLELLDVAYDAASAMPVNPHIKNRSRAQEAVVTTCFELNQPARALRYIEGIADWQRGSGYADFAFYCAQHDAVAQAQRTLEQASKIADNAEDWRRDVILVKIARTHALLGRNQEASALEANVVDAEAGKVAEVLALLASDTTFDEQFNALKEVLKGNNFDRIRNALDACVVLFGRFYDNQARRDAVEQAVREALERNVLPVRIDVLSAMADVATARSDRAKALTLIGDAQYLVDHHQWEADDQVALMGKMARLRALAGDAEGARKEILAAMALFQSEQKSIADIYRASALRPIAEAYCALSDMPSAMAVYKKAVVEGAANPNARPRAQDLVSTCCSLAAGGVEPDAELWSLIRRTRGGLQQPW